MKNAGVPVEASVAAILFAYMSGLAHAGHDDAPGRVQTKLAGGYEVVAETGLECVDGARFDIANIGGEREQFILGPRVGQLESSTGLVSL